MSTRTSFDPLSGEVRTETDPTVGAEFGKSTALVSDLASAAFANMPYGVGVYITSRGRIYWSVPVGKGDFAGTGNDWKSDPSTSSPAWLTQATWYIDPSAGSNDNSGIDAAHPIADTEELQARWGVNPVIPQSFTVFVAQGTLDHFYLKAKLASNSVVATIQGVVADALTTTIDTSGYTKYTHGTYGSVNPQATILKGTGVSDWTAYLNTRVRSGASGTLLSWVVKVNPAGGGNSTARTSPFGSMGASGSMLFSPRRFGTRPCHCSHAPIRSLVLPMPKGFST